MTQPKYCPRKYYYYSTENKRVTAGESRQWKRTKKTYSPMDDDEQKDKTHSTVSTINVFMGENKQTNTEDG